MMVSSEWYYEENIKGKSTDQIASIIRSLKRKIKQLEKVVANPKDYPQEWMICPGPEPHLRPDPSHLLPCRILPGNRPRGHYSLPGG